MDLIRKIAKQELLNEAAGISFIVRKWAKILKEEVETQLKEHREEELAKIKAKETEQPKPQSNQLEFDFSETEDDDLELTDPFGLGPEDDDERYNDPFYWEDETSKGKGSKSTDDWSDEWDEWESRFRYYKADWRNRDGGYYKKKKDYLGYPEDYGSSYGGYGGYGRYSTGSYKPAPYIPPLDEVVVFGDNFPEEYDEFSVDMWVLKNSSRIEYDHYESGYAESGEYVVYLNVPLAGMSESAFIHEIKHAYDDWNRMRHGGKPIRDTWEIKNIYTKDFEKLILGGSAQYPQLGPIVRYFYLGSKLETPAYLENEYDNAMVDYEDVGRKMMNFKASNYLDKRGNPARGLEDEFRRVQQHDIPLFKKFRSVVDFIYWVERYFNKRGRDIFKRVAKMRYVHNRPKPKYTATTYTPKTYTPSTTTTSTEVPKEEEDFEEGESIGGWKYSKEQGWYFDPDEDDLDRDMPY